MFTRKGVYGRSCLLAFLTCVAGAGIGCGAQNTALRPPRTDVRAAALLVAYEPALLLAGPGWLLHVNNEQRGRVAVYLAPKREGTVADCRLAGGAAPATESVDAHGRASVYVRTDEVACVAAAKSTRLSWHARTLPAADAQKEAVASLQ
jgi:hypothetical protein